MIFFKISNHTQNMLVLFLKGIAMGAANKIPGVSGGFIAFILGFYEKLIHSLKNINYNAFSRLFKKGIKSFSDYINGSFLIFIFLGVIFSYFSVSLLLDYLLDNYETELFGVFFGLILGSLLIIANDEKEFNYKTITALFVGLSLGLAISFLKILPENDNLLFVFFCGIISVSGMTIPGLSGSFLLIILGNYSLLLVDSVNSIYYTVKDIIQLNFDFLNDTERIHLLKIILVFTLGSVTGLVLFSNLLSYLLNKHKQITNFLIIGFITGSLRTIWPWKTKFFETLENGEKIYNSAGNPIIKDYEFFIPNFNLIGTWLVLLFIFLGILLVVFLGKYGEKKNE
jgi:putative membrane protein